ncbi:MAG: glycerate kinase [Candidatus Sigynarchaeota archaeon]
MAPTREDSRAMYLPTVQQKSRIIENGNSPWHIKARETLLELFEVGLAAVNPFSAVKRHVVFNSDAITIKSGDGIACTFPLEDVGRIFVVGGGKATARMAWALEDIFGDRIKAGFINVPAGQLRQDPPRLKRIKPMGASHPLPDQAGVDGVKKMIELSREARSKDLVFCLISGGGSALMPQPADDITLEDKRVLNKLLIESGATIHEINVVRKHASMVKGGWLARHFQPARVVGLLLSDVVGDDISTIASGPTAPDPSTFSEAVNIIDKYNLLERIPARVRKYFVQGMRNEVPETPKPEDKMFNNVTNVVIGSAQVAANEIVRVARSSMNIKYACTVTSRLEGEAAQVGKELHDFIKCIVDRKPKVRIPTGHDTASADTNILIEYGRPGNGEGDSLLLLTGETTVTIKGNGIGGRNQELLLSFLCNAAEQSKSRFAILSCGMDGIEGNSTAAGALIDDFSRQRAMDKSIDLVKALERNDSNAVFTALGDAIITGQTGTNVNDITMILIDVPVRNVRAEWKL